MIYVITHKVFDDNIVRDKEYRILHVGNNSNCKDSYLRDDQGISISEKNQYYCELTGLYWIWKNADEKRNNPIGLVHYRRFFTYPVDDLLYTYFRKQPRILTSKDIHRVLKKYDVILPNPEKIYRTVSVYYRDYHNFEDLKTVRNVIEILYPRYIKTFDKVMNQHFFYYGNMIIARKQVLNRYCEWLFNIMDEVEKRIDASKISDAYQSRVFGFLSERLVQVWIEHHNFKVKTFPVFNTENIRMNWFQKNANRLKHIIARRK